MARPPKIFEANLRKKVGGLLPRKLTLNHTLCSYTHKNRGIVPCQNTTKPLQNDKKAVFKYFSPQKKGFFCPTPIMSSQVPNTSISTLCGPNLGGLNHVRIIHYLDAETIFDPIRWPRAKPYTIASNNLQLKTGISFADIFFHANRGNFSEPETNSPHGSFHRPTFMISIPQDRPDVADWYYHKQNQKFIALYADANERYRLVGSPEKPLSISLSSGLGTRYSDPNGYVLGFQGESTHKSFYVEDISDDVLFPTAAYSFGFSLGFYS
jgi:hypothetical protein